MRIFILPGLVFLAFVSEAMATPQKFVPLPQARHAQPAAKKNLQPAPRFFPLHQPRDLRPPSRPAARPSAAAAPPAVSPAKPVAPVPQEAARQILSIYAAQD